MFILGVTGGVATGKSSVLSWFSEISVPVINCDMVSHDLIAKGGRAYSEVVRTFSHIQNILIPGSDEIDRKQLGKVIFENVEYRRQLERILHPMIKWDIIKKVLYYHLVGQSLLVVEIPLLYELGLEKYVSMVMVVYCDQKTQIERLMKREGIDETTAISRIKLQRGIEEKKSRADLLVDSSQSWSQVVTQIESIYHSIRPKWQAKLFWWIITFIGPLVLGFYLFLLLFK
jgi:dephospho-CoA kinase